MNFRCQIALKSWICFVFLWFSLILIKITVKNDQKTIKNEQKWLKMVKIITFCDNVIKIMNAFMITDFIKIMKNLIFKWFSLIIILIWSLVQNLKLRTVPTITLIKFLWFSNIELFRFDFQMCVLFFWAVQCYHNFFCELTCY